MRRTLIAAALWASLSAAGLAQAQEIERAGTEDAAMELSAPVAPKVDPKLQKAALQHEIVLALLDAEDYDGIFAEFKKILDLRLDAKYSGLIVEGTWGVVNALRERGQFDLSHRIVDASLAHVGSDEDQANLLLLKGKVFMDQNRNSDALASFEKAQKLLDRIGDGGPGRK